MRVLITGGAGYIGSHAAREPVRRRHEVRVYDNLSTGHRFLVDGLELVVGDAGDLDMLTPALRGIEAVMHFAVHAYVAESMQNPRKYFENNVQAGLRFLNKVLESALLHSIFPVPRQNGGATPELHHDADYRQRKVATLGDFRPTENIS